MTQEQAIDVLVKAVSLAQQKGVFSLSDAKVVIEALEVVRPGLFKPAEEVTE